MRFWDLPWGQRFVFEAGRRSEWRLGNWRVAVAIYSGLAILTVGAAFTFWPAAFAAAVFGGLAWISWHYGRHMKGKIQ